MQLYTVNQMRETELRAVTEHGISLSTLMDNAGNALARYALEMLPSGYVDVFCGKGNNGGDGYVCATALLRRGLHVKAWGVGRDELLKGSLAGIAADSFETVGGVIHPLTVSSVVSPDCQLIIDALLGTGLTRPLSGLYAHAVKIINTANLPVLSCDLPSGVDADTGQIMGDAVWAHKTLMLGLAKQACTLPPGCSCFGELLLDDIGLPTELVDNL